MNVGDALYLLPMGLFITTLLLGVIAAWLRPEVVTNVFSQLPGGERLNELRLWWMRIGGIVMLLILLVLWIQDWQAVLEK